MTRRRANPVNPAGQLSGGGLRDLARQVRGQGNVSGGGVEVGRTAGGVYLSRPMPPRLRAKLTALTGNAYSWTQQIESATPPPVFTDDADGLSGTAASFPAYEVQNTHVVVPSIADLRLSRFGDWYLFERCCPESGANGVLCDTCPGTLLPLTIYLNDSLWDAFSTCWSEVPTSPAPHVWNPSLLAWEWCWVDPARYVDPTACPGASDAYVYSTLTCNGTGPDALSWQLRCRCPANFEPIGFFAGNTGGCPNAVNVAVSQCSPFVATATTPALCVCANPSATPVTFSA
jgi:hypothetical protein